MLAQSTRVLSRRLGCEGAERGERAGLVGGRASAATGRGMGDKKATARRWVLEWSGGHGVGCLCGACRGRGLSALASSVVVPRAHARGGGGPGEQETEVEKNPLDYPAEWSVPPPSKRPDIWPEFEPMETPLPNPMPGDPEQPNEAEESFAFYNFRRLII